MPSRLGRHPDHMNVVLNRPARRFLRCLKHRPDIDIEANVGERRGNHLGATVMTVLAQLNDKHAWPAPLFFSKLGNVATDLLESLVALVSRSIDARDRSYLRPVAGEFFFQRVGNFADCRPRSAGVHGKR